MRKYLTKIIFGMFIYFLCVGGILATTKITCEYYYSDYSNSDIGNISGYHYCPFVLGKNSEECIGSEKIKENVPYGKDSYIITYEIKGNTFKVNNIIYKYGVCNDKDMSCLRDENFDGSFDVGSKYEILTEYSTKFFDEITSSAFQLSKPYYPLIQLDEGDSCPNVDIYVNNDKKSVFLTESSSSNYSAKNLSYKDSCLAYENETSCRNSSNVACIWNVNEDAAGDQGGYCNVDNLLYVGCGGASDIPVQIPSLISMLVNMLKIATPIILIFVSIITLLKAMSAGKEDEIKKATSSLVKKMIAGALVFFVIGIVQFVMSKVAEDDDYNCMTECFDCFLNNSCKQSTYYKTVIAGDEKCTPLTTGNTMSCKDMFK